MQFSQSTGVIYLVPIAKSTQSKKKRKYLFFQTLTYFAPTYLKQNSHTLSLFLPSESEKKVVLMGTGPRIRQEVFVLKGPRIRGEKVVLMGKGPRIRQTVFSHKGARIR